MNFYIMRLKPSQHTQPDDCDGLLITARDKSHARALAKTYLKQALMRDNLKWDCELAGEPSPEFTGPGVWMASLVGGV